MDVHTKEQRSYNMSQIRSENTKPELILYKILKKGGIKFKRHNPIFGKPDATLILYRVAIFIDGEFWHGKDFHSWVNKVSTFWQKKIKSNIRRDRRNDRLLRKDGWHVMHIWGRRVTHDKEDKVLLRIMNFIEKTQKIPD